MLRATVIVSVLALLGSLVSFLNQLVLARAFGAGAAMDAYLISISLPLTAIGLVSGMLNYQLVPLLQHAAAQPGGDATILRGLPLGLGVVSAAVALVAILLSPLWRTATASDAAMTSVAAIKVITIVAWIWFPLAVLGSVYTAGLHVRRRFTWATCWQPLPMAGAMAGCLIGGKKFGVVSVAWGQLAGYMAMVLALRAGLNLPRGPADFAGWRRVCVEAPLALASLLIFVIYPFSDAFWGTKVGPAAVSYLGYAQRLLVGLSGMLVVGLTTVIFPRLAQQAVAGDMAAMRASLVGSLRVMLLGMAPIATIIAVLALPLMQILFQRGAFGLDDARALAGLLRIMLFGMVAMSCMGLTFKALFARGNARAAATFSMIGAAAYFLFSGLLKTRYGLAGIGMAYVASWWLTFSLSLWFIWRHASWRELTETNFGFVCRFILGATIAGLVSYAGSCFLSLEAETGLRQVVLVTLTGGTAVLAYLIFGQLATIAEIQMLHRKLLAWGRQL